MRAIFTTSEIRLIIGVIALLTMGAAVKSCRPVTLSPSLRGDEGVKSSNAIQPSS